VGAIAAGGIPADPMTGMVRVGFFTSWLRPFPFAIGAFTLALFAFLAAVYLTLETHDHELRELFRARALLGAVVVGVLAALALVLSREHARLMYQGLRLQWWSMPFQIFTGAVAIAVIAALWSRRFRLARALVILQTTLILGGWALAQYPYIVEPDLMIFNVHAPERVLRAVLVALVAGGVVLVPALAYLFRVFKGSRAAAAHRPE